MLTKHHGLGNDFLIAVNPSFPLGADQARSWCDRRRGRRRFRWRRCWRWNRWRWHDWSSWSFLLFDYDKSADIVFNGNLYHCMLIQYGCLKYLPVTCNGSAVIDKQFVDNTAFRDL